MRIDLTIEEFEDLLYYGITQTNSMMVKAIQRNATDDEINTICNTKEKYKSILKQIEEIIDVENKFDDIIDDMISLLEEVIK